MSDDDREQLRLESFQNRIEQLSQLYDRFGNPREAAAIAELQKELDTIPEHIRQEDKVNKKVAEFNAGVRACSTRRRSAKRPPAEDIWETVRGFEQAHDPEDLRTSSLLKSIMQEARKLGVTDAILEEAARQADKSV